MQVYAAMIDRMDQGIGRVISTLEKLKKLDNTLILFLADNGGCAEIASSRNLGIPGIPIGDKGSYDSYREPWANASNTPYRYYKNWLYEGGIRTPLIICYPKVLKEKGNLTEQVGHLTDILPTCIEISGAKYPGQFKSSPLKSLRGKSLLPVIKGGTVERKAPVFWEYAGSKAMRQGNWKLVKRNGGEWELYDLQADPTEMNNLCCSKGDILRKMSAAYLNWEKVVGVRPAKEKAGE
jgi:arylsulfatase